MNPKFVNHAGEYFLTEKNGHQEISGGKLNIVANHVEKNKTRWKYPICFYFSVHVHNPHVFPFHSRVYLYYPQEIQRREML